MISEIRILKVLNSIDLWDGDADLAGNVAQAIVAPPKAPKLLVISTGTVDANQAMGLHSPVILDQDFTTGSMFGVDGTPMAVLVDAEGKIASEVAAGASAVLALAGTGKDPAKSATA